MLWLIWIIGLVGSEAALACSVCGFGQDGSEGAFILTTGIMTAIPLVGLAGVLFFITRKRPEDDQDV